MPRAVDYQLSPPRWAILVAPALHMFSSAPWSRRSTGPLGWCRRLVFALALIVAGLYFVILLLFGAAAGDLRLAAVVALAAVVGWWVVCYRRQSFPVVAVPAEAAAFFVLAFAAADNQRAIGVTLVGVLLRAAHGSLPAVGLAIVGYSCAYLASLVVAPPLGQNPAVLGLAQVVGVTMLGLPVSVLARALGRYEQRVARELAELQARLDAVRDGKTSLPARMQCLAVIARPVEEVFAFMTDPSNGPSWQSSLSASRLEAPGPIGVGSRVTETRHMLGIHSDYTYEVTEFEPNRLYGIRSVAGSGQFTARTTFQPIGEGTLVRVEADLQSNGRFKVTEAVVGRMVQRELEANLANLNDLLHARAMERDQT
jgi:hypothetical protein